MPFIFVPSNVAFHFTVVGFATSVGSMVRLPGLALRQSRRSSTTGLNLADPFSFPVPRSYVPFAVPSRIKRTVHFLKAGQFTLGLSGRRSRSRARPDRERGLPDRSERVEAGHRSVEHRCQRVWRTVR